jgi:hypothetical protein
MMRYDVAFKLEHKSVLSLTKSLLTWSPRTASGRICIHQFSDMYTYMSLAVRGLHVCKLLLSFSRRYLVAGVANTVCSTWQGPGLQRQDPERAGVPESPAARRWYDTKM